MVVSKIIFARSSGEELIDKNGTAYALAICAPKLVETEEGLNYVKQSALVYEMDFATKMQEAIEAGKKVTYNA